jgi:two-component system chemotaxis response regulator CheY
VVEHHPYQSITPENIAESRVSMERAWYAPNTPGGLSKGYEIRVWLRPETKVRANAVSSGKAKLVTVTALIVDDSPVARRVIRHHLTKFGCKVVGEADNAAQGMRLFDEFNPELVTLDIMMPAVEGVDALECFRAMRHKSSDVAVIIVSSVPFDRTRDTFLKKGAIAYMVKPFNQFSFEPVRQKLIRYFRPHAA